MQFQQPASSQLLETKPDEKQIETDLKSAQSVDAGRQECEGELVQPPADLTSPPDLGLKLAEESEGGSGT